MTYNYPFFEVEKDPATKTAVLYLNRPDKKNLMNWSFWMDLGKVVDELEEDAEVRAVVVAGRGSCFAIGIDFKDFAVNMGPLLQNQTGEGREAMLRMILKMQAGFNKMAEGNNVYIAAVHSYCIGGGLDLIVACDLRVAAEDAVVSLRETKVGIVADMGSLCRLPRIVGQGKARYMAFTGRDFTARQCQDFGLFDEVHPTAEAALEAAKSLAREIAANPSIAVRGTKHNINYAVSHSDEDAMKYVAAWNAAFLDSSDFREAVAAFFEKRPPKFL